MVPTDELALLPLFTGLERSHVEILAAVTAARLYERGSTVFRETEALTPFFHVLVTGSLQIVKCASSGKETVIRLIRPGDPFGWAAQLDAGLASATARVMIPCRVLMIPREQLMGLLAREPRLMLRLLTMFSERLRDMSEQLHAVVSERARTRLARLIQRYELREGPRLATWLPHQVLARMAGITYEESVRILAEWTHGPRPLLDYGRGGKIRVLDSDALARLADGVDEAREAPSTTCLVGFPR